MNALTHNPRYVTSELAHVGNVDNVEEFVSILGCGVFSLPLKYLGLPSYPHQEQTFQFTNILHVALSSPYGCVAYRIEKLQCNFLWGGLGKEFKYYLVS
jgi:hypothetical protein